MGAFLNWFSLLVLFYYLAYQLSMLVFTAGSAVVLGRERMTARFGRIEDMLTSDLAPPVSIVVAAYNEAAGIVESIRSMAMVSYPRFEIVVANDGSTDDTLQRLIDAFDMFPVPYPVRTSIDTAEVIQVYKSRLPIPLTVVDKVNGGKGDALNVAINAARYPYVMATDADVIIDGMALIHAMRRVAEDRDRVMAVGGNIRPINGATISHGHVVEAGVPATTIERYQLLEYVRAFVATRPFWSSINALPLVSGAFSLFKRDAVVDAGGFASGHMGEDIDLTMRIHRFYRNAKVPYKIVYSPAAVVWTEVPTTRAVLRRQRIRWHRGLMTAVRDFRSSLFNPRHGTVGMLSWPAMVFFEFLAPIIELAGYFLIPIAVLFGAIDALTVLVLFVIALFVGTITSFCALLLDERYGYFNDPRETLQLLTICFIENLGLRQITVWWRVRSMFQRRERETWGDMERHGVTRLAKSG